MVTMAATPDVTLDACDHQLRGFLDAFRDGTLPREAWTHEAHLIVAWSTLREVGDAEATCSLLIEQIRAYNRCDTSSATTVDCHQTLTRYYVLAIAALEPSTLSEVLLARTCTRLAPSRHWSPPVLASAEARLGWVEPDRAPLPWDTSGLVR
jgi:hypothetical protein